MNADYIRIRSNREIIESIFKEAKKIIPEKMEHVYMCLFLLEQDAFNSKPNEWVKNLQSFFHGLWAAQAIDLNDFDELDKILEKNALL